MKRYLCLILLAFAFMTFGTLGHGFAAVPAGTASAVQGEVKATTAPETVAHVLKTGDTVFMGDKIETGAGARLQVLLLDKTVFSLGASSAITVDEFVYDPATQDGKVKASLASGVIRIVSGNVAHKNPDNMVVNLPSGTMGFRGTDVVGIIDGMKTKIILVGPVGTGRIFVTNLVNGQVVTVDIDQAGFATIVDGPNSAPVDIFQVSAEELARVLNEFGGNIEGYQPPEIPDPLDVDTNIQNEEGSRDISPTNP